MTSTILHSSEHGISSAASTCGVTRRQAITFFGLGAASVLSARLPAAGAPQVAGPFETADFATLIPPDKKLRPEWVRSLFARGQRTVYSKGRGELSFIGMPVGGLCCGTLYLGGDGRLWLWDIFNQNPEGILPRVVPFEGFGQPRQVGARDGSAYIAPHTPQSPLQQGFALKIGDNVRPLDASGWSEISFNGEYPLARVEYRDAASPLEVSLCAYSPFVPLSFDDSSLPATIFEFTIRNTSAHTVQAQLGSWLENACCLHSAERGSGSRVNEVQAEPSSTLVLSRFDIAPPSAAQAARPDIVQEDFERAAYAPWQVEGDAFGQGPVARADVPGYQGDLGGVGGRVANSHASAPGSDSGQRDSHTGKITSPPFVIARKYLSFLIGGGAGEDVGLRLLVDGKEVRRAHGRDANLMQRASFEVSEFEGHSASIEIFDGARGPWGHVGSDQIVQTDQPPHEPLSASAPDFGTMSLAVLGSAEANPDVRLEDVFAATNPASSKQARQAVGEKLIGALSRSLRLAPGQAQTVTFVVAWHFPNSGLRAAEASSGNYYAKRFADAAAVARYVASHRERLSTLTKGWHECWYDSSLPFWLLDRSFANTSILATSTAHRFGSGRFWAWEGIGCCEGTCTHVWHYAQAPGRLFPEIERFTREHVDFGLALEESGVIGYRGERTGPAVDGQCGRILGALREHQMSADGAFLQRVWPGVKKALEFLLRHDSDGDGLLDGAQENTLDAAWFGKIAWISSLYAAALRAGEEMARERGDEDFAHLCAQKFAQSKSAIESQLFNGEYFIQLPQAGHENSLGTYRGCHIDQVHGQSWAWQVNLGRVLDRGKSLSALRALYKYNFAPDVGPFKRRHPEGRPYALAGEGGLLMATNPGELPHAFGNASDWQYGYFNECMSGFEHQAASHRVAEGLVLEGLAVTRAIHDRYHAARRNPWNEVECSDHYSRAMASYGTFVSACGFEHHGPRGHIGWAPRLQQENFKAAFTSAEGWGSFAQQHARNTLRCSIQLRHGRLRLRTLALELPSAPPAGAKMRVQVLAGGQRARSSFQVQGQRLLVTLAAETIIEAGQRLELVARHFA